MDIQPLAPGAPSFLAALFRGAELPLLSHALVALLLTAAVGFAFFRNKVLQLPNGTLLALWTVFGTLLLFSLLNTSYRAVSLATLVEWLLCLGAFVAAGSIAGHGVGPKALLGSVVAGCTVVAVFAIREYLFQSDPHWRVFGPWINSNALAGMLAFGLFAALGLTAAGKETSALVSGFCATIIGVAMLMAQSRGATLALLVGLATNGVATLTASGPMKAGLATVGKGALCLVAAFVVYFGMFSIVAKRTNPSASVSTSALSRVSAHGVKRRNACGFSPSRPEEYGV